MFKSPVIIRIQNTDTITVLSLKDVLSKIKLVSLK